MPDTDADILILGAGAAGLIAAVAAAESAAAAGRTRRIVLVEKNRQAGIKVLVCGGGRGNLSNTGTREELLAAFGRQGRWLADAFARLDNTAVCEMFARLGVPTKAEADGRVFPVSDKARDVVDALLGRALELGVQVRTGLAAAEVLTEPDSTGEPPASAGGEAVGPDADSRSLRELTLPARQEPRRVVGAVLVPADTPVPGRAPAKLPAKWRRFDPATWAHTRAQSTADALRDRADAQAFAIRAGRVVLAVGGSSYTRMGTTGDGYRICERLGHTLTAERPAIVPLITVEQWGERLAGVAVERAEVAIDLPKRRGQASAGDLLFTHFGLSGPAALNISDQAALLLAQGTSPVPLRLDLMPETTAEALDARLRDAAAADGKKQVKTLLSPRLPERLMEYLLSAAGADGGTALGQLPRESRRKLVEAIKGFGASVHATKGMAQAMVTAGGVALREVDPKTMESRMLGGLYLVGEMLDLTGPSGGYNLQLAWSTGWVAGQEAERASGRD